MAALTIYYVSPDLARPSGGVRTIYRHVDTLNATGFDAAVLHTQRGFRCRWFDNDTRIVAPPLELTSRDLLVIPEQHTAAQVSRLAPGVAKVIGNQNAYRSFRSSAITKAAVATPYSAPDVIGALVVSEDSRSYLTYAFPHLDVGHVHQRIDSHVFHPDISRRRKQIAVMPRKRPHDYHQVLGMLVNRGVLDGWSVTELAGMSEGQVAAALRESVLFISLSHAEGFGLPPAEAMASGCFVIGFHGMAGREYFRAPYAVAVEDGDVVTLAQGVEDFVATYDQRSDELANLAEEASRFVLQKYSEQRESDDLARFFECALARRPPHPLRREVTARQLRIEPRWRQELRRRLLPVGQRLLGAPES
jgi:hypothetical protein